MWSEFGGIMVEVAGAIVEALPWPGDRKALEPPVEVGLPLLRPDESPAITNKKGPPGVDQTGPAK